MSVLQSMPDMDRGRDRRMPDPPVGDQALHQMVRSIVQHVAALTEGPQIFQPIVGGITVQVRRCEHDDWGASDFGPDGQPIGRCWFHVGVAGQRRPRHSGTLAFDGNFADQAMASIQSPTHTDTWTPNTHSDASVSTAHSGSPSDGVSAAAANAAGAHAVATTPSGHPGDSSAPNGFTHAGSTDAPAPTGHIDSGSPRGAVSSVALDAAAAHASQSAAAGTTHANSTDAYGPTGHTDASAPTGTSDTDVSHDSSSGGAVGHQGDDGGAAGGAS
jgi:hypothetical protein